MRFFIVNFEDALWPEDRVRVESVVNGDCCCEAEMLQLVFPEAGMGCCGCLFLHRLGFAFCTLLAVP